MKLYRITYFLLLLLASCESKSPPFVMPQVEVTDFIVESKTLPAVFDFIGFAESSHPVEIRARVEGYLEKIAYQEGQEVHQGDLMFQLDPKQFEAKVAEVKAEVQRQEAILANAVLTVNRLTPLYQKNAASKKDLDNATSNQLAAEAALQSAKAQLLNAEINLGYTTIRSPITGLAERSRFREGALITPTGDSLLTTVSVLDPIWIDFTISDNDVLRAKQQTDRLAIILPKEHEFKVEAIMSDGSAYPHQGQVNYSSPTYDQTTGTLQVRAQFANPDGDILPGQFIRVKVYGAQRPDAIFVPQRALMQKKNGLFVYVIDKEGKVVAQDVSTGPWEEEYQIITNGLKPGDRVIVDGINKVRPGMIVKVAGAWKPHN